MSQVENKVQNSIIPIKDSESRIFRTSEKSTLLLSFLLVLTVETIGFFIIRSNIAIAMGQALIVIDLGSVIVLLFGAATLTYLYYTRYVRRELIFENKSFILKIGKRSFKYNWNEFKIVALSISSSHVGPKGFCIRLYINDLEGEYVEIPVYRFSKDIDPFSFRNEVHDKIKMIRSAHEKK